MKQSSKSRRVARVEDLLRKEISRIVLHEVKNPHVGNVTIMACDCSPDLHQARVFFKCLDSDPEPVEEALKSAAGFIRRCLGKELHLRHVPKLVFVYDLSVERGLQLGRLVDSAVKEDARAHQSTGNENE